MRTAGSAGGWYLELALDSGFSGVPAACGVCVEYAFDFVANLPEDLQLFLSGAGGMGGINKAPVMAVELSREDRARLVRITADGDHGLDLARQKFAHVLAVVRGDVDANFAHHFDGERVDVTRGLRACACHV